MRTIYSIVYEVVSQRDAKYPCDDGDAWIGFYDPGSPYLRCYELAEALAAALEGRQA